MSSAVFAYDGLRVRVSPGSLADLQWLKDFFLPWFDLTDGPWDVELEVSCDQRLYVELLGLNRQDTVDAFMLDKARLSYPRVAAPGEQLGLHDPDSGIFYLITGNRIRLITEGGGPPPRTATMRVVRELAMGSAQLSGSRFLHASSFALGDRAAIIAGPRRAGKTSLLCYVLANSPARFLSNDRLLARTGATPLRLRGMPTIVSIREGTMDLFPGMREDIIRNCYANRLTLEEARRAETREGFSLRPDKHGLNPRQFCALMQSRPVAQAEASVLLFPRQTGRPGGLQLRPLARGETRRRLDDCLFTHIGPDRLSDAFTLAPPRQDRVVAPDDTQLCDKLADVLPGFDCELGTDSFRDRDGARHLIRLLDGHPDALAGDRGIATGA